MPIPITWEEIEKLIKALLHDPETISLYKHSPDHRPLLPR